MRSRVESRQPDSGLLSLRVHIVVVDSIGTLREHVRGHHAASPPRDVALRVRHELVVLTKQWNWTLGKLKVLCGRGRKRLLLHAVYWRSRGLVLRRSAKAIIRCCIERWRVGQLLGRLEESVVDEGVLHVFVRG